MIQSLEPARRLELSSTKMKKATGEQGWEENQELHVGHIWVWHTVDTRWRCWADNWICKFEVWEKEQDYKYKDVSHQHVDLKPICLDEIPKGMVSEDSEE